MAKLIFKNDPNKWHTNDYPDVPLTRISWDTSPEKAVAYVFFGHPSIDYDGSPTAYGPPEIQPPPDDNLKNAWNNEKGWFGVIALSENDPLVKDGSALIDKRPSLLHKGKYPVIQQAKNGDPKPKYYVSATPRPSGPRHHQNSYVDASKVAFGALDKFLRKLGVSLGDYGLAIRHNADLQSGFFYEDMGGWKHALGECSHKVGKNLGGSGRANHFNNNFPVSFIIFPNSEKFMLIGGDSDDQIKASLKPLMRNLSLASNARELALLMGFNEVNPPGKPRGLKKLEEYVKNPDKSLLPTSHFNVVRGLSKFGFDIPITLNDI